MSQPTRLSPSTQSSKTRFRCSRSLRVFSKKGAHSIKLCRKSQVHQVIRKLPLFLPLSRPQICVKGFQLARLTPTKQRNPKNLLRNLNLLRKRERNQKERLQV
ncbi:unnamed protein product [Ixodes pacificus]